MGIEPGQILDGKYRVGRLIGEGGMGTVYEGENSRIGRRVAIKVLHARIAAMPEFVERFEREAKAAARIGSRHVCDVLDLGDLPSGDRYIVMEFLDGVSFEDRLAAKGKLTAAQLAPIAFELLEGLGTMHNARVIHRDLKPANVLLTRDGQPKIADFGLARDLVQESSQTQTGQILGTPSYMAPEQALGIPSMIGPPTDVYALGAILYEMLTGQPPFIAPTVIETLDLVRSQEPVPPRRLQPKIPRDLETICLKCLEKRPQQRYASAQLLADDLSRFLDGKPVHARPVSTITRIAARPTTARDFDASVRAAVRYCGGCDRWTESVSHDSDRE